MISNLFMKKLIIFSLSVFLSGLLHAQTFDEPFWNQGLPVDVRVKDLLSRLTIDEKTGLLVETSSGVPRLEVPKYFMGNEALHGVVRPGKFTVFPQAIGLAAMWNPDLLYRITTAISDEARGRWNELQHGKLQHDLYSDLLVFWSPDLNLARDPRWGRTQETYGEDPFLASRLGVAFVKGLQGNDPDYLKVVATPKHYTANNEEHNRFECNALFSERSLREYYLVPFEYAIKEGKAASIMSAYNAINGMPCTISKKLLTDILRDEWGFNGYAVSDCGGPSLIVDGHHYFQTYDSAAVACIRAGLDLECGTFVYRDYLKVALDKGWIKESQIDTAVSRVLKARFRMGVFDRDLSVNPYNQISPSVVGCEKHQRLALEAARQSIVLLKNKNKILPLDRSTLKKVAVFGPNANNCVFGDYSAKESANEPVSVIQGLKNKLADKAEIIHYPWTDKYDQEFVIIPKECLRTEDGGETGLSAEYYRSVDFQGTPVRRVDEGINFNPAQQAPDPDVPSGKKSIRWKGLIVPNVTGKYTLAINTDDGVRFFLNDKLLVNQWKNRSNTTDYVEIDLEAGKPYRVKLEYFDSGGNAIAQFRWKTPGTEGKDIFKEEKEIAATADVVIAVLGLNTLIEAEGTDKKGIELPEDQQLFIEEIFSANPRTVVVLETGSPLAISWIDEHIPAVLCAWYAGEQGGNAIADVLFGDYNPAGRLPLTFYKSTNDLLPFDDYEIMKGRTYMYSTKTPLYPFGFGLSYTRFDYSGLKVSKAVMGVNDQAEVSVNVKNTGNYDGDEVVQIYVKNLTSPVPQPVRALKGFERINLRKNEAKSVIIPLTSEAFRYFNETEDKFVVEPGTYEIQIGTSSEDIRLKTRIEVK
jgi:beta-glucosidase